MVLIRTFEEKVAELFSRGKLPGIIHTYIGEEAIAVGVCANLRKNDYIASTHRGHGHCIAKGVDIKRMMAELYGKKTGTNKGKGGSMHIADYDVGMLGACGIVGGGIPIITGAGLSARIRETDQVAVSFFGDGAVNQGSFHESLNLASVLKLPVIYVCENNLYGEGTPLKEHVQINQIADRAKSYNMPQSNVDGNDVMAVYNAAEEAVLRAREGKGPTLIECITYRWRPHAEGYPLREMYLGREVIEKELSEWKKNCPLKNFQSKLINRGVLKEEQIGEIYLEARENVEEAVKFAEQSPYPGLEEAFEDIYAM